LDYLAKRTITKKEQFHAEIEQVVPFERLSVVIEPHNPKNCAKGGIQPNPIVDDDTGLQ
jgi:hypothetical protein